MAYRVFILEDDAQALETLRMYLHAVSDMEVVGHAADIEAARILLPRLKPDLLLSDVILPPHTSFDLLHTLDHIPFEIIFITSFEEFAIKAFRLAAVDYLLKPVAATDLITALDRFRQRKQAHESAHHIQHLLANLQRPVAEARIALPTLTGFLFVAIKDIVRCESDNTYTTFYTLDKQNIIVSRTLKECEQMLGDYRFFRVHNSHLVNLDYITEYVKGEGGIVKMTDGSHVDVSRRRKDEFLKRLK
ncbi:MAG: response regulator transcription factor [Cyclobacteriaceae bacterium]|nr:response regulator transcription factor [Cyclobacteriaceae bacterium]